MVAEPMLVVAIADVTADVTVAATADVLLQLPPLAVAATKLSGSRPDLVTN